MSLVIYGWLPTVTKWQLIKLFYHFAKLLDQSHAAFYKMIKIVLKNGIYIPQLIAVLISPEPYISVSLSFTCLSLLQNNVVILSNGRVISTRVYT